MDENSIANFQSYLKEEAWDSVYNSVDMNNIFNIFHCTLLSHFESSFPIMYKSYSPNHNGWMTKEIRISCKKKRDLSSIYRHSNSPKAKEFYKKYSVILKKVIIDAKKLYYDKQIELSSNRVRTTWNIIKDITGRTQPTVTKTEINSEAGRLTNINDIAKAFNIYFTYIAEDLNSNFSDVSKALQSLKESYPECTSEMKLIPVSEIEVINI